MYLKKSVRITCFFVGLIFLAAVFVSAQESDADARLDTAVESVVVEETSGGTGIMPDSVMSEEDLLKLDAGALAFSVYVQSLLDNEYLLESVRLINIAVEHHESSRYNQAEEYALEAIRFAQLSDSYVSSRLRIREAEVAIMAARERLEFARRLGIEQRHPEIFARADSALTEAIEARENEDWEPAHQQALEAVVILSEVIDTQILPAQVRVRTWEGTRDSLWNIAGRPEIYGDPTRWPVIYQANRGLLAGNPHLILPGMILQIPSIDGEIRHGILDE